MRILVLGSGGREHAIVWKLSQSTAVEQVFLAPGNGGSHQEQKVINIDLSIADFPALVKFAIENEVDLVIPGPEQPLVDGVESHFRKVGIPVFGPSQKAARMEGSKAFSKAFMQRHSIPTANFRVFTIDQLEEAILHVRTCGFKVVLKASGLAAGKGVLIPETTDEAIAGLREIMVDNVFGDAGNQVVIEELLEGPELSVLAFCDGYTIVPLPAAQDHKRIGEGDTGPNTGGMGAYAPAPIATPALMDRILKESLQPTIDGMRKEGFPFVGILFTGFMITEDGPKVLEYNVRFGDPETEALMLLLSEDTDIAEVVLACAEHRLDSIDIKTKPGFAVSVVLASQGYPGSYPKGKQITIGSVPSNVVVFHAGTALSNDQIVTSGGRVLAVSAHAETLQAALDAAYSAVASIKFDGKTYRRDIAHRALRSASGETKGLTYADAGVSIDAGNSLVQRIKPFVRRTQRTGSNAEIGGFGGVFDLKAAGYQDPVLVSGTDGVGTKLHVAVEAGVHGTVGRLSIESVHFEKLMGGTLQGIDLVAMSVNDLIVQGAEPLYFLDYFACGHLDVDQAASVINGIAEGCVKSGCALIGGETAEMPGMYKKGDYDLAGFAVGAVERSLILPRSDISIGDILIGLPSSGIHSNGFSLVRKIVSVSGLKYSSPCPWDPSITLGAALLEPTKIYVKALLPAIRKGLLKGLSHITGGGFLENIPRVLPSGMGCYVNARAWELPPVFKWLMKEGGVQPLEMARTFNNGMGMILIVSPDNVVKVARTIQASGEQVYSVGEVIAGEGVQMRGLGAWSL